MAKINSKALDPQRYACIQAEQRELEQQYSTHITMARLCPYCCLLYTSLQVAFSLRVSQNVFGFVFALAFCVIFYWFMPKKKESEVTVHAVSYTHLDVYKRQRQDQQR